MRDRRQAMDEVRRTAPWAGAWVDLLDGLDRTKVLLIDPGPGRAAAAIVERGAELAIAEDDPARAEQRRALLPGSDTARLDSETALLRERWDTVVVEGEPGNVEKQLRPCVHRRMLLARHHCNARIRQCLLEYMGGFG